MKKQHRRIGLVSSASVLALMVSVMQPAHADTTATVGSIVPGAMDPADILNTLSTAGGVLGTTNILSDQILSGLNTGTATTTGTTAAPIVGVGNNAIVNNNNNSLFALTRGLNVSSTIGNNASADGSVIMNAQQLVPGAGAAVTTLTASTTGSIDSSLLLGNGNNVTGNLNNNSVRARTSFNSAFATIETTVPNTLNGGVLGGYVAGFTGAPPTVDPSAVAQTATYNIASVQANSGFANGAAPGLATTVVDDTLISLTRAYLSFAPATISGTFRVNGNLVDATTVGNAADNGILLETGVASSFNGTAFSSSTQLSRDTTVPLAGSLPGISATNTDTIITANLFNLLGSSSANNLTVRLNGNRVSSGATINESSNLVGFDSGLNLAGGADSATALAFGVTNNVLVVFSDFATVNLQNAFAGTGPTQSAFAETDDATMLFLLTGATNNTTATLNENALSATARGNINTNLLINHSLGTSNDPGVSLGTGDSATIVGSFNSANRQLIYRPDIEAIMTDSEIQALIGTLNVGGDPFGGFAGSTLRLNDNSFSATAIGNGATALIDLQGSSIDSDTAGSSIVADREDVALAQVFTIGGASGISIANLQFNAQTPGTPGSIVSTVRDNTLEAVIADDQSTVEDFVVSDSTVTMNGNGFQASSTINAFSGLVNLSVGTTVAGDATVYSSQTTGGFGAIDMTATLQGNQAAAILGIGSLADSLTVRLLDNGLLALATGNDAAQNLNVTAGTAITGDTTLTTFGDNAHVVPSAQVAPIQETLNTEVRAAGAFVVVNDQAINFSDFLATATGNVLTVALEPSTDGDISGLADSALRVSGNQIGAQVLGNNADNGLGITAGNGLGVTGTGAIGGIANSQTAAVVLAGDITLAAVTTNNSISVSVLDGDDVQGLSDVVVDVGEHIDDGGAVHRNSIGSTAFASIATNTVTATGGTIGGTATGVTLSVVNGPIDQTLSVDDTALYVLNRQRNEALDPDSTGGAAVSAFMSDNAVTVFVNGGEDGVDSSRLNATGNILNATAAANVASNSIASLAGTTASLASGILSRQGNSGNVTGTNGDSAVSLIVTADGGAEHTDLRAEVNRNVIGSSAIGNSVTNTLAASAGTTLSGTNGAGAGGAFIGATPVGTFFAEVDTATGTVDSNSDATVLGNAGILSTQRNYGLVGDPSLITSPLANASVSLAVTNDAVSTTQGVLSVSLNQAVSQAAANVATNHLTTDAGTTSAGSATVLNSQGAALTNVLATAADTSFSSTVDGPVSSATLQVSNNVILASADLNSASNSITSSAGVGGLPSATILNHQEASGSSVSSSVSGSSVTQLGLGGVTNSTVSVSNNQVGTSSTINNAVNKIAAPAQSFTRTSSF